MFFRLSFIFIVIYTYLFFFSFILLSLGSTLFPYTTLFRSSWKRFCLFVCRALSSIMVICMLTAISPRSEERFSRNAETDIVCRLLLEKKKNRQELTIVAK